MEELIRTVRDGLVKTKDLNLDIDTNIKIIEERYNETFHRGIKMMPKEAFIDKDNERLKLLNSEGGEYANKFKDSKREKFIIGQQVRIASKENLDIKGKMYVRFQEQGVITQVAGIDSYIVKEESGKIYKISHSDLKGISIT